MYEASFHYNAYGINTLKFTKTYQPFKNTFTINNVLHSYNYHECYTKVSLRNNIYILIIALHSCGGVLLLVLVAICISQK